MNEITAQIPIELQGSSWFQALTAYIVEQRKLLEEQSKLLAERDRLLEVQSLQLQEQKEQIAVLKINVQELKDELARVKRLPRRPKFRPPGGKPRERSGLPYKFCGNMGGELSSTKLQQEIKIAATGVPEGSRFKGYQNYIVQEVEMVVKDITYRLEVWQTPDGRMIHASLPEHIKGTHFGPELRGLIHNLYAACMTEPEIFNFLTGFGVQISTGQIHNILMGESDKLYNVSTLILEAGLEMAPYISADDTGAKHEHKNVYCTQVGGQYFSFFQTSSGKSRSNFLKILLQGKEGYCINEAFMRHIDENTAHHKCKEKTSKAFQPYLGMQYKTVEEMNDLLNTVGLKNKGLRLQCIEAGVVGFISQTMLRPNQILLSDRAGQFAILDHAACWVHMERPLRKLIASQEWLEQKIKRIRGMIWDLYDKVKIASTMQSGDEAVHQRKEINKLYDELIAVKTKNPSLKTVIESFAKHRHELLKALDHPGLPLHTNASERDLRNVVKRRNVSGSTKSDAGKHYRDALTTIKQTCRRLGISFFGYMKMWFSGQPIDLPLIIRNKYRDLLEVPGIQLSG